MAEGSVTNVEEQAWILNKIICYFVIHPWIPVVSPDPSGLATGTWLQYWGLWEIWTLTCCCLGLKCRACSLLQPRVGWQLSAIIVSTGACSCWVPGLLSTKHKPSDPAPSWWSSEISKEANTEACMHLCILRIPVRDKCGVLGKKSDKTSKWITRGDSPRKSQKWNPNMVRHKNSDLCSVNVPTELLLLYAKGTEPANNWFA